VALWRRTYQQNSSHAQVYATMIMPSYRIEDSSTFVNKFNRFNQIFKAGSQEFASSSYAGQGTDLPNPSRARIDIPLTIFLPKIANCPFLTTQRTNTGILHVMIIFKRQSRLWHPLEPKTKPQEALTKFQQESWHHYSCLSLELRWFLVPSFSSCYQIFLEVFLKRFVFLNKPTLLAKFFGSQWSFSSTELATIKS